MATTGGYPALSGGLIYASQPNGLANNSAQLSGTVGGAGTSTYTLPFNGMAPNYNIIGAPTEGQVISFLAPSASLSKPSNPLEPLAIPIVQSIPRPRMNRTASPPSTRHFRRKHYEIQ